MCAKVCELPWEQLWQQDDRSGWARPCMVSMAIAKRCLGQNASLTWDRGQAGCDHDTPRCFSQD